MEPLHHVSWSFPTAPTPLMPHTPGNRGWETHPRYPKSTINRRWAVEVCLTLFESFHCRRCDAFRKRYGIKRLSAHKIASDERKLAPGVVSFVSTLFQRCRHPRTAFAPDRPSRRKQLHRDCLDPTLARSQGPQQVFLHFAGLEPGAERLEFFRPPSRRPVRTPCGCRTRPLG